MPISIRDLDATWQDSEVSDPVEFYM